MASSIDPTKPAAVAATTQSVRDNFTVAKAEIEALQAGTAFDFVQAGAGAVSRTGLAKLRDAVHIKDYGALCDGVADDTAEIIAALTANPNKTVLMSGTPLISSTITLDQHQRLVGDGGTNAGVAALPSTYLKKAPSMTTVALTIRDGSIAEGFGVVCSIGSTGGGVELSGHAAGARYFTVVGLDAGGLNGTAYRIGDAGGNNTNGWFLDYCYASGQGILHGIHAHDGSGGAPDANAGKALKCEVLSVFGDGVRNENANNNVYDVCIGETVTGYALHIVDGDDTVILGGDWEASVAGQIQIEALATRTVLIGINPAFTVVDLGYATTIRLDTYYAINNDWQPNITGSATTTKAITSISRSGTTVSLQITGHAFIVGDTFSVTGTESSGQPKFNGGYKVATVPDANNITATVTADRASKLPLTSGAVGNALVGYAASLQQGWWRLENGIVYYGARIINAGVAANALMSGNGIIRGFPLPVRNVTNESNACTIAIFDGVTFPASTLYPFGMASQNAYSITLFFGKTGASAVAAAIGAGGVSATADITINGSYRAA